MATQQIAIRICTGTFIGIDTKHPDYKPTFSIVTDEALYFGPSMAECSRLLNKYKDKTPICKAGPSEMHHRIIVSYFMNELGFFGKD